MPPAARLAAAIEVYDTWILGDAGLDRILTQWSRQNRYAGSGDRRRTGGVGTSGTLSITSGNTATFTVFDDAVPAVPSGQINLYSSTNDFGEVFHASANTIALRDTNDILLGDIDATGDLTVQDIAGTGLERFTFTPEIRRKQRRIRLPWQNHCRVCIGHAADFLVLNFLRYTIQGGAREHLGPLHHLIQMRDRHELGLRHPMHVHIGRDAGLHPLLFQTGLQIGIFGHDAPHI